MLENYFKKFDFKPLNDFVSKLKKQIKGFGLVSGCYDSMFLRYKLKSNLELDIHIDRYDNISTNITFYLLKDGNRFEMVKFFLYNIKLAACKELHTPEGTNRSIQHDYRMDNGDNLTVYSSMFDYEGNDYISGHESIRKLSYQEFHKKLSDEVLNSMLNPIYKYNSKI